MADDSSVGRNQTTGTCTPRLQNRRTTSSAILNVSGKGWRDRVPELYEDPTKKKKDDEENEEPAEE